MNSYKVTDSYVLNGLHHQRIAMDVPLSYSYPNGSEITISINVVQKYENHPAKSDLRDVDTVTFPDEPKPIAFLQGGPGFPCPSPSGVSDFTRLLIDRGYQVILYDQRGTGYSSPIDSELLQTVEAESSVAGAMDYILNFRADSIVQDMDRVRTALLGSSTRWSLLGQSFGGFSIFTYLSMFPKTIKEALVTGGIPPIGFIADDVYTQTYKRTAERNTHYYSKYPQDVSAVFEIMKFLSNNPTELPNGGTLSPERFQQLGILFGASGGTDKVHDIVNEFWHQIHVLGLKKPNFTLLSTIQEQTSFDTNVLYALFQEAIYCDGGNSVPQVSNWAADRLRHSSGNSKFVYCDELVEQGGPVYFTGEMVYRSMFDDYVQLRPLKALAEALHSNAKWTRLYDVDVLSSLNWEDVPIVAATYYYDQYVDFDTSMKVKENVFKGNGNLKQYITSEYFHNGLRADPEKVLGSLFKLLDCEVD